MTSRIAPLLLALAANAAHALPAYNAALDVPADRALRPREGFERPFARVVTPAHVDSRRGVPSFTWAARDNRGEQPWVAGGEELRSVRPEQAARRYLYELSELYRLTADDIASARLLEVHDTGSLKARRQVVRRVLDRVRARFNVSAAEVGAPDAWQRAEVAFSLVGGDRRYVNEQMDKVLGFVEQMYVAPVVEREMEILSLGDQLYGDARSQAAIERHLSTKMQPSDRSLAEAEGLGDWDERHGAGERPGAKPPRQDLTMDEARARARSLRNRRDWEKP